MSNTWNTHKHQGQAQVELNPSEQKIRKRKKIVDHIKQ